MTEPTITPELVQKHNLTTEDYTHASLVKHPERAYEPLLASDDSKWIFESILAAVEMEPAAQAA